MDLFLSGTPLADVCGRAAAAGARYVLLEARHQRFEVVFPKIRTPWEGHVSLSAHHLRAPLVLVCFTWQDKAGFVYALVGSVSGVV